MVMSDTIEGMVVDVVVVLPGEVKLSLWIYSRHLPCPKHLEVVVTPLTPDVVPPEPYLQLCRNLKCLELLVRPYVS